MLKNPQFFSTMDKYARNTVIPGLIIGIAITEYLYLRSGSPRLMVMLFIVPGGALLGAVGAYLLTLLAMAWSIFLALAACFLGVIVAIYWMCERVVY